MVIVEVNEQIKQNSVPYRISNAIMEQECEWCILTAHTMVQDSRVIEIEPSLNYRVKRKLSVMVRNFENRLLYSTDNMVPFSYFTVGQNVTKYIQQQHADVVILHWVCGEFLSIKSIKQILRLGKPIIWICHDNWPFTGGCHVRLGCEKYVQGCGKCPQLHSRIEHDWSYRLVRAKRNVMKNANITVVSPSTWMDQNVAQSMVFKGKQHFVIPNPIDTDIYIPTKENKYSDKITLLFGAVNAVSTPYKGYKKLIAALEILEETLESDIKIEAYIFGSDSGDERAGKKISMHYMGYLQEEQMVKAYQMADIYIVPSLEDSFNSTVVESMSCETPVVAFATGGITDIIDHKVNGYLAEYANSEDLAKGIKWVIENNEANVLGKAGREKALREYSYKVVGRKYYNLVKSIVNKH